MPAPATAGTAKVQKIQIEGLQAPSPTEANALCGGNIYQSPEARELLEKEGPKYQYGNGCLSDGVLGAWMAEVCGVGEILDPAKVLALPKLSSFSSIPGTGLRLNS